MSVSFPWRPQVISLHPTLHRCARKNPVCLRMFFPKNCPFPYKPILLIRRNPPYHPMGMSGWVRDSQNYILTIVPAAAAAASNWPYPCPILCWNVQSGDWAFPRMRARMRGEMLIYFQNVDDKSLFLLLFHRIEKKNYQKDHKAQAIRACCLILQFQLLALVMVSIYPFGSLAIWSSPHISSKVIHFPLVFLNSMCSSVLCALLCHLRSQT